MDLTGGCLCGAVRYRVDVAPSPAIYACHCLDCQTHTGSAFALQMPIAAAGLRLTGNLVTGDRTMPSGSIGTIHCCAACLVRLYNSNSSRPGIIVLRAGTLDDSAAVTPRFHLWVGSKQHWVQIPHGVPALPAQPATLQHWQELLTS